MQTLNLKQGTPEWKAARAKFFTASEASAMMGASKYKTRDQLLHEKATGLVEEVSEQKQRLFDKGHAAEEAARPIAEEIIGEELFPVVGCSDDQPYLASFDGMTMLGNVIWEHKLLNKSKVSAVDSGTIPETDYWQLVHQLVVSGAEKCLYMVSDGTEESYHHTWFELDEKDAEKLISGWDQFALDLNAYQIEEKPAEAVGRSPESLPALLIQVSGEVSASNLDQYRDHAMTVLNSINTELNTDQDFANAEKTVKWCKDVESKLEAAKDNALAQTASIDELFRTIDAIREETRAKRLELDKLVKARKEQVRVEIKQKAEHELSVFITGVNDTLWQSELVTLPLYQADFAGAMKGKKTVSSLQSAVNDELAKAKIEINCTADQIRLNLKALEEKAGDYRFLFNDLQSIITKPSEDFEALLIARIAQHKQAEEEKRQREEAAKAQAEQLAKAEAESATPEAPNEDFVSGGDEPVEEVIPAKLNTSKQPSADDLIEVIAKHYGVPRGTALNWIRNIITTEVAA